VSAEYLHVDEADVRKSTVTVLEPCDVSWTTDRITYHPFVYRAQPGTVIFDWSSPKGARREYSARCSCLGVRYYPSREAS
jgi:hypothetical protein